MSDFDEEEREVSAWLEPLVGESGPCGPDLEYDNDFLAISQAAAGKPESQFGAAEPPDWRAVSAMAEALLARSRDLRVAILWLRAGLHLQGYGFLPVGLTLLCGLIERHWEHVHPLPDPDDGDPYARVNALALLREPEGLVGDLRDTRLIEDRAIGLVTLRGVEVALGLSPGLTDDTAPSRDQLAQMVAAAVAKLPALRARWQEALAQTSRLMAVVGDKLGASAAPDLRPVLRIVSAVAGLPSSDAEGADQPAADTGPGAPAGQAGAARRGLAGEVTSRAEAIRAIELVCDYLERTEPTNPAPLFLRRASQLIGHNFLQLLKELAPDALAGVAGMVGVDPEAVESPNRP